MKHVFLSGGAAARSTLVLAIAAALAGCGYTETHEVVLRQPMAPVVAAHPVDLYMAGQPVPHGIYEVAFLQVVGRGTDANLEDLVKALTTRARTLGCDAVANIQVQQGYSVAHAFGVCVQYASIGPAPIAAPPPAPNAPPNAPIRTAPGTPLQPATPALPAPPPTTPASPQGTAI